MSDTVLALAKNDYILTELGSGHWDIRYVGSKFPKAAEIFDAITEGATDVERSIALAVWARPAWRHIRELGDKPEFSIDNLQAYARQGLQAAKLFSEAVADESDVEIELASASYVNRIRDCFNMPEAMKVRASQALDFAKAVLKAFDPESEPEVVEVEQEDVVGLPIEEVPGIHEKLIPYLKAAGFLTAESVASADDNALRNVKNVTTKLPPLLRAAAQKALDAHELAELDKALNGDEVKTEEVKTEKPEVKSEKVKAEKPKAEPKKAKGKKAAEESKPSEPEVKTDGQTETTGEANTEPEVQSEEVKTEGDAS